MDLRGKIRNIELGPDIILFGDSNCNACVAQYKVLRDHYMGLKKPLHVKYYDLSKKPVPSFLAFNGIVSKPTWYFPKTKTLVQSLILPNDFGKLMGRSRGNKFGSDSTNTIDYKAKDYGIRSSNEINFNQLAEYGKNFKNPNQGFQINDSWTNTLTNKWGNPLDAGTLGREFGPGNTDKIYSKKYYNQPRMLRPGDDLSETLYTNRNCNLINNPAAQTKMTGLFYDDLSGPGLVANQFGKRRSKKKGVSFGNLYSQMGPSYTDVPLMMNKYSGAQQNEAKRPNLVGNKNLYIGQAPTYNPLTANYKINTKLGEGTELILRNNKIIVKN
jgi:hypothetical protein